MPNKAVLPAKCSQSWSYLQGGAGTANRARAGAGGFLEVDHGADRAGLQFRPAVTWKSAADRYTDRWSQVLHITAIQIDRSTQYVRVNQIAPALADRICQSGTTQTPLCAWPARLKCRTHDRSINAFLPRQLHIRNKMCRAHHVDLSSRCCPRKTIEARLAAARQCQ